SLVEGAVGALDDVPARPHELGEGVHPHARDAREVIAHVQWSHGSGRIVTNEPVAFRPPARAKRPRAKWKPLILRRVIGGPALAMQGRPRRTPWTPRPSRPGPLP